MRKKDCFYLGKIVRKHSFRGEVVIKLDTDEPHLYENMESVFVLHGTNLIPFFIEKSLLQKGNQLRTKFEGVDTEADADGIMKSGIYLPVTLLPKLTGDQFYYHEIIGFTLEDVNFGEVGKIIGINEKTAQPLFEVDREGIDIFIPMIDNFIKKIDRENNKVIVETPEGLIDLYL